MVFNNLVLFLFAVTEFPFTLVTRCLSSLYIIHRNNLHIQEAKIWCRTMLQSILNR